jgi:hypothetical protein
MRFLGIRRDGGGALSTPASVYRIQNLGDSVPLEAMWTCEEQPFAFLGHV